MWPQCQFNIRKTVEGIMANVIIFVRQKQTLKFLGPQAVWVIPFAEARTFKSTWEACDFCLKHSIHKAQIVMRMGNPIYDVTIDIV